MTNLDIFEDASQSIWEFIKCKYIILLMHRKLQQEQQGFFPSIPIINFQPLTQDPQESKRPFDYQPRVLLHAQIQRRLPIQIIQPVDEIPSLDNGLLNLMQARESGSLLKGQPVSPYEKYACGSSYKLVYAKYKKTPFVDTQDCSPKNKLEMSSILKYDANNYLLLKQQILEKQKESQHSQQKYLIFDSKFQCGNLYCAYQSLKEANTYDCFIEYDTNAIGYTQWFYFSIQNVQKQTSYKFNIVNMGKRFSFFKMGKKPTFFSAEKYRREKNGWFQKGYGIKYKASDIYDMRQKQKVKLYSLTFQIDFQYADDYITISHGVPYSYSRLIRQLKSLKNQAISNDIQWNQQTISHTISNNQVPYLTISKNTNPIQQPSQSKKTAENKIILILARQHSGQMNSSFVMQKILQVLARNKNSKVQWLLNRYQFRVFPMINVDGVIYGNSRCDIVGFDLNRCWKRPIKQLHPQIFAIKSQIQNLSQKNKIVACIDLHSHSKQLNIFSYCNKYDQIESRLFSLILQKNCPFFHFPSCTFGLSKEKQGTARAVIGSFISNQKSMTIQCSSFGYKKQAQIVRFRNKSFQDFANAVVNSLKGYLCHSKYRKNMLNQIQQNIFKYRSYCKKNWELNSGSDSQLAQNQLQSKLRYILPHQFIAKICKRLKQTLEVNLNQNRQIEYINSDDQFKQIPPKIQKISKIIPKKISVATIQPKIEGFKRKQLDLLSKKNIDRQASFDAPPPSIVQRPNQMGSGHLKTQPKVRQSIQYGENNKDNIRKRTPNRSLQPSYNAFENSMKIIYRQLKNNNNNLQQEQHESCLLIVNARQVTQRRLQIRNENKLEKILKIRRKTNNFKSILRRQHEKLEELTLLKIRSEQASITIEPLNRNISPIISTNSKMDRLINHKDPFVRDRYVSHIAFLNKFLRNNIKETFRPQQC